MSVNKFEIKLLKGRSFGKLFIAISIVFIGINDIPAQDFEIKHEIQDASGWFGGDDRPYPASNRTVGNGQSVFVDSTILLKEFSFYFTGTFKSPAAWFESFDITGHEVTIVLNIRDSSGVILQTEEVVLPETFDGGWATWSNIDLEVNAKTTLLFTSYLLGAKSTSRYFNGIGADSGASYEFGERYTKQLGEGIPGDIEDWDGWTLHPWDSNFRLHGTLQTSGFKYDISNLATDILYQNYPNPFRHETLITYHIKRSTFVTLRIYNVLGECVAALVDQEQSAGEYEVNWFGNDLKGIPLQEGIYFYHLITENSREAKSIMLLR